jgi:hypothetical protein
MNIGTYQNVLAKRCIFIVIFAKFSYFLFDLSCINENF